jgi:Na+-driven multidrug efflux pump
VALVLTVTFDLLLIPRWGVLGAAIASSIAYSVIFFLSIGFYRAVSRRAERQSRS